MALKTKGTLTGMALGMSAFLHFMRVCLTTIPFATSNFDGTLTNLRFVSSAAEQVLYTDKAGGSIPSRSTI